jgi:hypothetical protein
MEVGPSPKTASGSWSQNLHCHLQRGVFCHVKISDRECSLAKTLNQLQQALTCNSAHTKHSLEALCPEGTPGYGNIRVMRHPDHNVFENAADMTFYWVCHMKLKKNYSKLLLAS